MISIQHACLPSVLAYAAATTLPPSPTDSPPRCETPTSQIVNVNLSTFPIKANLTPAKGTGPQKSELPITDRAPETPVDPSGHPAPEPRNDDPPAETDKLAAEVPTEPEIESEPAPRDSCTVTLAQFANQLQLQRHQRIQKLTVQRRLWGFRVSISLSLRLLRISTSVQRGLVESFKHGDKSGFASTYHGINEIRDLWESFSRRHVYGQDEALGALVHPPRIHPCSFTQRLTPRSREDLLDILTRVRTDSDFLFRCINDLTPAQVSALISPTFLLDANETPSQFGARNKSPSLFSRRTGSHSNVFKECAFAFERTDPLSALLFNVFAAPLVPNSPESRLRLDVWSSTCAKLISRAGSSHFPIVGQILSIWSSATTWNVKPKLELYLMDVLQKGAFLLECPDNPRLGVNNNDYDPLRTDVAEQFFQSAVNELFVVLDDSNGGLPAGAVELANAILAKIHVLETRKRFLDFIFFQWFFRKFLPNALLYPEAHGLLLDFHITKDARDRLLDQISQRVKFYVSQVLHTAPQYALAPPKVKFHVENMLSHFDYLDPKPFECAAPSPAPSHCAADVSDNFMFLSSTDITTILDALFPKPESLSPRPFQTLSGTSSPTLGSTLRHEDGPFNPTLFQGRIDTVTSQCFTAKPVFPTEIKLHDSPKSLFVPSSSAASPVSPQESLPRSADRIRYELCEINESEDRYSLDNLSNEDWAMISISNDGRKLTLQFDEDVPSRVETDKKARGILSTDDQNTLESAVMKLVDESDFSLISEPNTSVDSPSELKRHFMDSMARCQQKSDFTAAHYWWTASRLLRSISGSNPTSSTDDKVLRPMLFAAKHITDSDTNIFNQSSPRTAGLKHTLKHLQNQVKATMDCFARLRNKMWYMTDVKNSSPYEDARNVALALKSMAGYQAMTAAPEPKPKLGARSLGASVLQKPEIQVMNVMRASVSQGGPMKLSDEQVDVTRKWLQRSGIDNFCRGEERIHRFCYEVKTSVSKLVGESIYDSPVLWSSELYQKERSMFEASSARPLTGLSTGTSFRPPSIASEDNMYQHHPQACGRNLDSLYRAPSDVPLLIRKSSFQSLGSDRWKGKDNSGLETSSIGDSPGRAASTVDSCPSFWSPIHTQAQSTTSISSFQSRPASMASDVMTTRRFERTSPGKAAFLDELRPALTSLLLSDLGSPVWSLGSETDAWFSHYLNQPRIGDQMAKQERLDRFLAELSVPSDLRIDGEVRSVNKLRRTRSAVCLSARTREARDSSTMNQPDAMANAQADSDFEYDPAFRRLMDQFSRPANPYAKLKALNDLRSLVVSSLMPVSETVESPSPQSTQCKNLRLQRNSISEGSRSFMAADDQTPTPSSPAPALNKSPSRSSMNLLPTDSQIIRVLRGLIQKFQPKTLFRDLQFIAAFVPSELLNKVDAGTAFLQFGLAAFELKDDVCHSMVEIADRIVSQELSRRPRHSPYSPRFGNGIEDAARMWTITAQEGNPVAQRELAILYLTHPERLQKVTLPLTMPRDTFKAEMMYRRDLDPKSDPQSMCLALHWMQLSAAGGDELAQNRLREREEFESLA